MVGPEDESVFEDGGGMEFVGEAVLDFLPHDEVVVVDVGFEDRHKTIVDIHDELHLCVEVQHSLTQSVLPHL